MKLFKRILLIIILFTLVAAVFAYSYYKKIFDPNVNLTTESTSIYIPAQSGFGDVLQILMNQKIIQDSSSFVWVANQMNYIKDKIPGGKFEIQNQWSNRDLISSLRAGLEVPINLTINQLHDVDRISSLVSSHLEADSSKLVKLLESDELLSNTQVDKANLLSLFIPNTYQFNWDTDAQGFIDRMEKERKKYWTEERMAKAAKHNLSPAEVYTLASIVEKETQNTAEKPRLAGVYLNRLDKGILLQADPTVVYALGKKGIRRVLTKHLKTPSPYNTYIHAGLPPGPICMPSMTSIEAVLNAETHDYLFFCAKPDNSGTHAFAETLRAHNNNANKFHKWLNERKIFK